MRLKVLLTVFLLLLIPLGTSAANSGIVKVDGHFYYQGDKRFPGVLFGNRAASYVDLTSMVVSVNNAKVREVKLIQNNVNYSTHQTFREGILCFKEDKTNGALFVKWADSNSYTQVTDRTVDHKEVINAYELTKSR